MTTSNDIISELLKKKKALGSDFQKFAIFIVAYEAVSTIESTLERIPEEVLPLLTEIYMIDDFSEDESFEVGKELAEKEKWRQKLKVYRNPRNYGYGGNQKVGYRYAVERNFDYVILLHGDGQYAPEYIPNLMYPVVFGQKEVVFGSRMINKKNALSGGMPYYKFFGNIVLSSFENLVLGLEMSEFHSGYRLYSVDVLRRIPFEENTDDFHFDTQIIIQCSILGVRIHEVPIPTYYGGEICRVNGMKYAFDVCKETLLFRLHQLHITRYGRYIMKDESYQLKSDPYSSHQQISRLVKSKSKVLDLGCASGFISDLLSKKEVFYTGIDVLPPDKVDIAAGDYYQMDLERIEELPFDRTFDYVILADVLEHLVTAKDLLVHLRSVLNFDGRLIASTGNIAIWFYRVSLALGRFQYGPRGILDETHVKLYTLDTFKSLLESAGYTVVSRSVTPIPFELVFSSRGKSRLVRWVTSLYHRLAQIWPRMFAFQVIYEVQITSPELSKGEGLVQ